MDYCNESGLWTRTAVNVVRAARLVEPGNLPDDLPRLAECDWILEAVVEDPRIKRALYAEIDKHRKPGAIVSLPLGPSR